MTCVSLSKRRTSRIEVATANGCGPSFWGTGVTSWPARINQNHHTHPRNPIVLSHYSFQYLTSDNWPVLPLLALAVRPIFANAIHGLGRAKSAVSQNNTTRAQQPPNLAILAISMSAVLPEVNTGHSLAPREM